MNSSRLKSIIIVILVLTNSFLLVLLLGRRTQKYAIRERRLSELTQLYAAGSITLEPARIPDGALRLTAVDPTRSFESEAAFAESIIGSCSTEEVGGGIYRYANGDAQCLIRSSGSVEASLDRAVDDPEAFCEALFSAHGYGILSSTVYNGTGEITAVRTLPTAAVFNAELLLRFSGGRLISVIGQFVPPVEAEEHGKGIDSVTALVRFLDYSNINGEVCTAVTDVRGGYLLQSATSAPQRLLPVWRITTDVAEYYVNASTGEVTRE